MNDPARHAVRTAATILAVGGIAVSLISCGNSSSSSSGSGTTNSRSYHSAPTTASTPKAARPATGTKTAPAATGAVAVTEGSSSAEFTIDMPTTLTAGKTTFTVTDGGAMPHQFVLLKTSTQGASLAISNGAAVETGKVGSIPLITPGATKTLTVTLQPGHYVALCNLPGHYQGGMWKDVTVS